MPLARKRGYSRTRDQALRYTSVRRWKLAHKDRVRLLNKKSWLKNRDSILRKCRARWAALTAAEKKERRAQVMAWELRTGKRHVYNAARRILMMGDGVLEAIPPMEVFVADKWVCYLCERPCNSATATLDHVVPLSRGGTHTRENLRTSHKVCNQRKNALPLEEYRARYPIRSA